MTDALMATMVATGEDVALARRRARDIAARLGYSHQEQTRVATAVSEVARYALRTASPSRLTFTLSSDRLGVEAHLTADEDGPLGRDAALESLSAVRVLVDDLRVVKGHDGLRVLLEKKLAQPLSRREGQGIIEGLQHAPPATALEEIREQNQSLLAALDENHRAERALRASEARLALAVDTAELGTWTFDSRRGLAGNDRFFEFHDLKPGADLDSFLESLSPDTQANLQNGLLELRSEERSEFEVEYRTRSGRWFFCRARRLNDGEPGELAGIALDVTTRKEREFETAARAEFQDMMLGVASHDLRSPLSTIKMGAELVRNALGEATQERRVLTRVEEAAERARRLVTDLLDYTQHRLGQGLPLRRRRTDLRTLSDEVVRGLRVAFAETAIELEVDGDLLADVDPDRMSQVLTNLVDNAVEHGEGSRVSVRISGSDDAHVLQVRNRGRPIPDGLLPMVFEPLAQGSTDEGRRRGLGLGLHIVKLIAEAHGGRVSVTSGPEQGTQFTVEIPRN